MFPYVVPNAVTIHEAAAPHSSLQFMLVGASVLIPIILAYTGVFVLGVPRQDRTRGISLSTDLEPSSALRRWLWFVGLWAAGVGATGRSASSSGSG